MIKKQNILANLICFIVIVQLISLSTNSSGQQINEQNNFFTKNSVDSSLIEAEGCSELAQWDNNYGDPNDIFVQDTLLSKIAYVTLDSAGLLFYDISNPSKAKLLGHYTDADGLNQIEVKEKYAFITGGDYGLKVLNVGSPKNAKLVINFDEVDYISNFIIHGNYIYGLQWRGLFVIDISDPKKPFLENTYELNYLFGPNDMRIKNNFLYLIGFEGIEILDISNPRNPEYVTTWEFGIDIYSFDLYDSTAIITNSYDVFFFDITVPQNYSLITKFRDVRCQSNSIQVVDHYVFSFSNNGFICFDVEDPNNVIKVNEFIYQFGYLARALIQGEFIYLIDYYSGIVIIYIGDLTSTPVNVGNVLTNGHAADTYVQGNVAYVANYGGGLDILDIDNPTNPKLITRYKANLGFYSTAYLENSRLYLANYFTQTIDILDVTSPDAPVQLNSLYDNEFLFWLPYVEMVVKNEIAFVIETFEYYHIYEGSLSIVNCTNPANISVINSLSNFDAILYDLDVVENHLFLATSNGLLIFEIENDYELTLVSEYSDISSLISGVFVEEDTVYLAAQDYGLIILDVTDTENPVLVGSIDTDEYPGLAFGGYEVFVENNIIYLADLSQGLLIYDGTDPSNPIPIGSYFRQDYSPFYAHNVRELVHFNDIFVSDDVVFLASGYSGLLIVHQDDLPTHWMSLQNIIIISLTTTIPFVIVGLIVFVIWRIKKRI
ncbi:MAG: hypothetical protein KGD59_07450 [Candidatus Heimdallarchaeota archaeon]|nr:hypothetical protein [Candidatus Heimdallarchaeota archaeon]MBY8994370.1 hypothetical protein [Candidatus Heimdallarchaeota archaeon]